MREPGAGRRQWGGPPAHRAGVGAVPGVRRVHARPRHRGVRPRPHRQHAGRRAAGERHPGRAGGRPGVPGRLRRVQGAAARGSGEQVRRQLRATLLVGGAVLVAVTATVAAMGVGGGSGATTARTAQIPATAAVTRATLTRTQQVSGTLDYGEPITVNGRGTGTVTWLPGLGAVVSRGQPVYRVDDRPVSLFYGGLPLYRTLHAGDTGDDVREVESNLAALGYTGLTVDR